MNRAAYHLMSFQEILVALQNGPTAGYHPSKTANPASTQYKLERDPIQQIGLEREVGWR